MAYRASAVFALLFLGAIANAQEYITKGYFPPTLAGATTCAFSSGTGNTPATCPVSAGVPLTDEGKPGSTTCAQGVNGTAYEGVFSLSFPSTDPSAVPGCTSDAQCGGTGVICANSGPTGTPRTCFPLAPSGCPFPAADAVNSSTTATAGRKLL